MEGAADHGFPVLPLLYFRNLPAIRSEKPADGSFLRNTVPACLCSFARSALLFLLPAAPASPWYIFLSDVQDGSISDQWKNSDPAGNKPPFPIPTENQQATSSVFLKDPDQRPCLVFTGRLLMDLFLLQKVVGNSVQYPFLLHSPRIHHRNILHFQHLTENGISHSIVALPADLISIRIDHRY